MFRRSPIVPRAVPGSILRSRLWPVLSLVAALTILLGDARAARPALAQDGDPINVVATIGMIGDTVANVGGDRVKVTTLMGPGIDPHLYKASAKDLDTFERADVIFYNGLHLEGGLSTVLEEMGERTRTKAVTDRIPRESLRSPPEFQGNYDPHVWFDVKMWKFAVGEVRDTLIEMDPDNAAGYEERAMAYMVRLDELDAYVMEQAQRVPEPQRVLVTAHDAFGYFGRRYGFEVRGLQGISTATEAGTGDVQDLADFIAQRQIPAIFVESSVPPRTIEALQEAVRSRGWDVQIGGQLFSDAMGDPDTDAGTYIGMVRSNIDTIVGALAGGAQATPSPVAEA